MNQSAVARLESAAAAGQDQQLSRDPAFSSLSAGRTKCLALAARSGHLSTVQLLLRHRAYTPAAGGFRARDAAWRDLVSALVEAARHGHLEMAAALLMVPTRTDESIAGDLTAGTALDAAAAGGHGQVVQLLTRTIPQQDADCMYMRSILRIFLAWDSRHAAQQRWSSFAWYSRIRPQFAHNVRKLRVLITLIIGLVWALSALGWMPSPYAAWIHPLSYVIGALLFIVHSVM